MTHRIRDAFDEFLNNIPDNMLSVTFMKSNIGEVRSDANFRLDMQSVRGEENHTLTAENQESELQPSDSGESQCRRQGRRQVGRQYRSQHYRVQSGDPSRQRDDTGTNP